MLLIRCMSPTTDLLQYSSIVIAPPRPKYLPQQFRTTSAVSSSDNQAFATLELTFRQVFGDLIVVPGLTVAGTDTVHYSKISDDSYRINPFMFTGEDIERLHGRNERISVEGMIKAVQFYTTLIRNVDAPG